MMIIVTLTWSEVLFAAQAASMRRVQGMKYNRAQCYGGGPSADSLWQIDSIACLGEMALAKHLDRFWSASIGDVTAADIGTFYQVRATEWASGRLMLHPPDKDHQPYVLARVRENIVTLVGWVYGREGKRQEYWTNPQANRPERFAYFVPNDALHDMADIPRPSMQEAAQ
jgi:hypothetical protein